MVTTAVFVNVEPFDVVKFPAIQANHVAVTILYEGMNGKESYRIEFGPSGGAANAAIFQAQDGLVTLTHSQGHVDVSGLIPAGKITQFIPWLSDMVGWIEGVKERYSTNPYQLFGENHGHGINCRDFVRRVLIELIGNDDVLNKIPLTPRKTCVIN